jgi:hypothetical protein
MIDECVEAETIYEKYVQLHFVLIQVLNLQQF